MKSATLLSSLAIVWCLAGMRSAPAGISVPACSPDTATAKRFQDWLGFYATAPAADSEATKWRGIIKLPAVAKSQIVRVTASSTCSAARTAYAKLPGLAPATSLSVIVVKARTTYFVVAPTQMSGEYKLAAGFDSRWRNLSSFTF